MAGTSLSRGGATGLPCPGTVSVLYIQRSGMARDQNSDARTFSRTTWQISSVIIDHAIGEVGSGQGDCRMRGINVPEATAVIPGASSPLGRRACLTRTRTQAMPSCQVYGLAAVEGSGMPRANLWCCGMCRRDRQLPWKSCLLALPERLPCHA